MLWKRSVLGFIQVQLSSQHQLAFSVHHPQTNRCNISSNTCLNINNLSTNIMGKGTGSNSIMTCTLWLKQSQFPLRGVKEITSSTQISGVHTKLSDSDSISCLTVTVLAAVSHHNTITALNSGMPQTKWKCQERHSSSKQSQRNECTWCTTCHGESPECTFPLLSQDVLQLFWNTIQHFKDLQSREKVEKELGAKSKENHTLLKD